MDKDVRHIMESKGGQIWSVSSGTSVYDALELMAKKGIGALLVIDDGKITGIMSERDYARKITLLGKSSKDTPVSEIMSTEVVYVLPSQSADMCMALMTEKRIRHLPVMENDKLLGIVSIGDVVKAVIDGKEDTINELTEYITGRR